MNTACTCTHVQQVLKCLLQKQAFCESRKVWILCRLCALFWLHYPERTHYGSTAKVQAVESLSLLWEEEFRHFRCTLMYRPSSRIVKPDALSCQFASNDLKFDTVLPPEWVVITLTWTIKKAVQVQAQEPDPGNGPVICLFVPVSVHFQVLQWTYVSRFSCHPGVRHTISLLKRHFWWPRYML